MNHTCERIRERIEDSIGRALGAEEQAALDLHCAECESCREYRARLIDDHSRLDMFATLHSTSEKRFEERVIEMLPAGAPTAAQHRNVLGTFARIPGAVRVAAAVAAAIVVVAGIDFLRGAHNGAVPAFAAVVERMEQSESLIYRCRRWSLGEWTTMQHGTNRSGFTRDDFADSTRISYYHGSTRGILHLYPATKRAVLWRVTSWSTFPETNPVESMALWHKRSGFSFIRRERYEGRSSAVYELRTGKPSRTARTTIWVDLETELPFRVDVGRLDSASWDKSYPYGLDVSDFMPPDSPRSAAAGWTDRGPGEPAVIWDNFRWNVQPDTSYFSLSPPPGYAVSRIDTVIDKYSWEKMVEKMLAEQTSGAVQAIAEALSAWVSLSGGAFPDDIEALGDSSKVRPLLIAKYDKDGRPGDEFRAAIKDAKQLNRGFTNARYYKGESQLQYMGREAAFGDSTRIVCWGEETGETRKMFPNPYWIIYADLRCVPSKTPPKILEK